MNRLTGKVALVTGGARGIGRATALKLAEEGADIVVCDIASTAHLGDSTSSSAADLESIGEAVRATGRRRVTHAADVRDDEAVDRAVRAGVDGLGPLDIVFANAGIVGVRGPFWELTAQQWREVIDVNLTGMWNVARAVAPHLISRQQGSIVLTSSVLANDDNMSGIAAYMA